MENILKVVTLVLCCAFAPSYTPVSPPRTGLTGWYDFTGLENDTDNAYGIVASNAIGTVKDLSGSGHNFTQATGANKPTLDTAANGLPCASFDGGDHLSNGTDADWKFLHSTTATIAIWAKAGNTSDPNAFLSYMGSSGASSVNIGIAVAMADRAASSESDGIRCEIYNGGGVSKINTTGLWNDLLIPNIYQLLVIRIDNASSTHMLDFIATEGGGGSTRALAPSSSNATYDMQIGACGNNVLPFLGQMQEILIYNVELDIGAESQLIYYFKQKYAID